MHAITPAMRYNFQTTPLQGQSAEQVRQPLFGSGDIDLSNGLTEQDFDTYFLPLCTDYKTKSIPLHHPVRDLAVPIITEFVKTHATTWQEARDILTALPFFIEDHFKPEDQTTINLCNAISHIAARVLKSTETSGFPDVITQIPPVYLRAVWAAADTAGYLDIM